MRKLILLAVLMPTLLYCNGKPKIQFETMTHDFGAQPQTVELKYVFNFKNAGEGTLRIEKIEAG